MARPGREHGEGRARAARDQGRSGEIARSSQCTAIASAEAATGGGPPDARWGAGGNGPRPGAGRAAPVLGRLVCRLRLALGAAALNRLGRGARQRDALLHPARQLVDRLFLEILNQKENKETCNICLELRITMRRNLLNWCNLVSIRKKSIAEILTSNSVGTKLFFFGCNQCLIHLLVQIFLTVFNIF